MATHGHAYQNKFFPTQISLELLYAHAEDLSLPKTLPLNLSQFVAAQKRAK
jgi:hypothetical protein